MTYEPHDQHDAGGVQPSGGHGSHGGYPDHSGYGETAYGQAGYGDTGHPDAYGTGNGYGAEQGYGTEQGYGHEQDYEAGPGYDDGRHAGQRYDTGQTYDTPAHGYHPAPAPGGWGGEYDSDATAFVQLPGPGIGLPAGADPLAAPGTGQGGYTPPSLADFEHRGGPGLTETPGPDPAAAAGTPGTYTAPPAQGGAPMTPAATTDPSSTGQWTLPFAAPATDPADFGVRPGDAAGTPDVAADDPYAHLGVASADTAAEGVVAAEEPAAESAAQDYLGVPSASAAFPAAQGGAAAAMAQGAAAALAGSHEARSQRRPLGAGGAAGRTDEPDTAAGVPHPAGPLDANASRGPGVNGRAGQPHGEDGHRPHTGNDAAHAAVDPQLQLADSMARRQVPFTGTPAPDAVSWPEPGTLSIPRPAGPDPVEQTEAAGDPAAPAGPIPYADSSPGHGGPAPSPDGEGAPDAPAPHDGGTSLPAPLRPGVHGEPTGGATWPEPGTFATPGGPLAPGNVPFGGPSAATDMSWPEPGEAGTPAPPPADTRSPEPAVEVDPVAAPEPDTVPDAVPAQDASAEPETAAASEVPAPPSRSAEGSPPSRIPFVASTPGREAHTFTGPITLTDSAVGGEPTATPSDPPGGEDPDADHHGRAESGADAGGQAGPGAERHEATGEHAPTADGGAPGAHPGGGEVDGGPGGDGWSGAPGGPGPDDSGEYASLTAQPAPAEPVSAEPFAAEPVPAATAHSEHPHVSYVLRVNGVDRPVTEAWIGESLLYVLRERLGLAGAKDGCSQGECGACSVQVDGRLVASCLVPAATAAGSEVRTVEGLAGDGEPSDVQDALARCGAVQCGFCVPGLAMAVHDLLEGNHAPTELETRQAICGNLCRCSGYRGVLDAVETVVSERAAAQAAEAAAEAESSSEEGGA